MVDGGLNGERLSEVSRLAGVLADQVLLEPVDGDTSLAKLTALGKAALLLQDYDRPIPDRVVDVLGRALRGTKRTVPRQAGRLGPTPRPVPRREAERSPRCRRRRTTGARGACSRA